MEQARAGEMPKKVKFEGIPPKQLTLEQIVEFEKAGACQVMSFRNYERVLAIFYSHPEIPVYRLDEDLGLYNLLEETGNRGEDAPLSADGRAV